jgi:sterol desaturase/sphingolipid hydroxylase (fatty acid hydroxylase superfamily)
VTDGALVSFIIYLVVFDFANYWLHRAQHRFNWWWACIRCTIRSVR